MTDHERARRMRPLRQIEAYWQSLADRSGTVPLRHDIDPRRIQDALEYAFIAERIAPGLARLRVAGAHLTDLLGMEVSGLPLTSFILPDSRAQVKAATERVFAGEGALHIEVAAAAGLGRLPLSGCILLLPLRSDTGRIDRALGGFVTMGRIGRVPRRFDVTGCHERQLDVLARRSVPQAPVASAGAGFAEPPVAPFLSAGAAASPAPYLRLVVSND